jgi:glycosyltransferase involved in cell wall biosynthesis
MNNYSICITTFSKRFSYIETLISQIRKFSNQDILISINGDYKKDFDNLYREKILNLCLKYENIYPIFFPEQRGLSKLWNTLIIHSKYDWCLMLNDDIEIESDDIFIKANYLTDTPDLIRINGSFSHFFVHKVCIDEIGYFDERLLGFGEEDGDIFFRYIEKYNRWIQDFWIGGVKNLVIDVRDENIRGSNSKYSAFNSDFCFVINDCKYKSDPNGIQGCFGYPKIKFLEDLPNYSYEKFFKENKNNL